MCDHSRNPINCVLSPYMTETLKDERDQDNQRWVEELEKVMEEYRQARQNNRPSASANALAGATEKATGKKWGIYHHQQANLFRLEGDTVQNDEDVDSVYNFAASVHHFLQSVFGLDSMDGAGMPVHAFVRWQPPSGILYPNASWLPHSDKKGIMIFGEGDEKYFAPFSRDLTIFAHEYAHGLVQYNGGLRYEGEAGALNESFADVFASLVLQHSLDQTVHQASWLIGENVLKSEGKGTTKKMGLRSLIAPGTAYIHPRFGHDPQPWHYKWYDPNESVHYNSGIPNHAFYLLAYRTGGRSWQQAGRIWVETLLGLKDNPKPDLTIREWAIRTIQTAMRLRRASPREFNRRTVPYTYAAWDSVGVKIKPSEVR
jgi:Zn-dependent metalloprotease